MTLLPREPKFTADGIITPSLQPIPSSKLKVATQSQPFKAEKVSTSLKLKAEMLVSDHFPPKKNSY